MLQRYFSDALTNILSTKLRATLAILGILVGTAATVALITSSKLATAQALAQFKTLGTQLLAISISNNSGHSGSQLNHSFGLDDVRTIKNSSKAIISIAPYSYTFNSVIYRNSNQEATVIGALDNFYNLTKLQLKQGRFISQLDQSKAFAVIGADVAKNLRQNGLFNPIGHQLLVGQLFFTVIGVLEPWQPNLFVDVSINNSIIVPLDASYQLADSTSLNSLLIKLNEKAKLRSVQTQVEKKLKHLLPSAHINIRNPEQILTLISRQRATFTWLLVAIASISLFVGAIGVMNILLVSVVERQREIGIRLAIGARQRDILVMFLIESIFLTMIGGSLGVIVGVVFSYVFSLFSHWVFHFMLMPILLGFFVSIIVGILSGFYPAFRASRLDPIVSLHAA